MIDSAILSFPLQNIPSFRVDVIINDSNNSEMVSVYFSGCQYKSGILCVQCFINREYVYIFFRV